MKLTTYTHITDIDLLPSISISHSRFYDTGELNFLSLDIGWLKWGISFIFVEK
jgi:hypothetical protein